MKKKFFYLLCVIAFLTAACSKEDVKSSEKAISSFEISDLGANSKGKIDEKSKTITFEVGWDTDVSNFSPVIVISPFASISPASGVAQDFSKPVVYKVTAEDGTMAAYTVTFNVAKFDTQITAVDKTEIIQGETLKLTGKFIPGKTTVALEGVTTVDLKISSESETEITVEIPSNVEVGKYTLSATSAGAKVAYKDQVEIFDLSVVITSVNKVSFMKGYDQIIITGRNFRKENQTTYILLGSNEYRMSASADGRTLKLLTPRTIPATDYVLKVKVGTELSNEKSITVVENTFPIPVVSNVSRTSLFISDEVTITGSNFAEKGNSVYLVRLVTSSGAVMGSNGIIVSESPTSITIRTTNAVYETNYKVRVTSNGQNSEIFPTEIAMSFGPCEVTSVSPTLLKANDALVIKGKYLYGKSIITIDGVDIFKEWEKFNYSINDDITELKILFRTPLIPGIHELVISKKDQYGNPTDVISRTNFTVE